MLTSKMHVEGYGIDRPGFPFWGAQSSGGALIGVAFRLGNTMIVADSDGSCAECFADLIDGGKCLAGARGSLPLLQGLASRLRSVRVSRLELSYLMRLDAPPPPGVASIGETRRATMEDLDPLAALYVTAGPMYRARSNISERLLTGRVFITPEPGATDRVVSCAVLNVEGASAALLGGVFTTPAWRGRGFAAACTASLSADLQASSILPTLFYENPIAGRVYSRLGYRQCGEWGVLYFG